VSVHVERERDARMSGALAHHPSGDASSKKLGDVCMTETVERERIDAGATRDADHRLTEVFWHERRRGDLAGFRHQPREHEGIAIAP